MTLKEYVNKNYSSTSAPGYCIMIDRFIAWADDKAETATYTDILDFINYLRKKGLHPKSLRNNLFAVKIYYRWLVAIGKREDHPCQKLYLQDKINRAIPVENLYPKEILEELLNNHKSKRKELQKRDETIISLLIYQALTSLEISQLKTTDIDLEKGTIRIKGNVKNKGRTIDLKPRQIMLFYQYLNEIRKELLSRNENPSPEDQQAFILNQHGQKILSGSVNQIINHGRQKHKRMIPLKIRQSVIAHLVKSGNDIRIVQVFAGHRRAESTEEYKQTGLEELKTLIQKLHPLEQE